MKHHAALLLSVALASFGAALAAFPPEAMNYQGVLRDASDHPLTGAYDMTFRFYNDDIAGDEILVDRHTAAAGGAVTVTNGLFNVLLGWGSVSDGSGPGSYSSLSAVFRDYMPVWMSIQIGGEVLSGRVGIASAAYAFNATTLGGLYAGDFINTGTDSQSKNGSLTLSTYDSTYGLYAYGGSGGGYFYDYSTGSHASVAQPGWGITGYGTSGGGYFSCSSTGSYAYAALDSYGVYGVGTTCGGYFTDTSSSSYAYLANQGTDGIIAGSWMRGARFNDTDHGSYADIAFGPSGIEAYGPTQGGYFSNMGRDTRGSATRRSGSTPWGTTGAAGSTVSKSPA